MSIPEPDNEPDLTVRTLEIALALACGSVLGPAFPPHAAERMAEEYRQLAEPLARHEVQRWTITEAGRAYLAAFPEGPPEEQL